jgi:hypothetical protein
VTLAIAIRLAANLHHNNSVYHNAARFPQRRIIVAHDRTTHRKIPAISHQSPTVFSTVLVGLLFLVQLAASCGGGSSGVQPPPPPTPTFTTVDASEAGLGSLQGTIGIAIDAAGDVTGTFIDSNNALHGFLNKVGGGEFTIDAPGASSQQDSGTQAADINASREVAGYFLDAQGLQHSFIRGADGTITAFDPPNGTSGAQSINDSGTVAGGFLDSNGAHGYLRAPDGTFTIFDLTGDATQVIIVVPKRINTSGAVAGTYTDSSGVLHGFLRATNGTITELDAPGAGTAANEGTDLTDMNTSGVIVGGISVGVVNEINTTHSLILAADGTYTVFDPPQSGAHSSLAVGINDSGVVVGEYRDANLVRHGYLRQPDGTFTSFDDPDAAQLPLSDANIGTTPRRINASGAVTGYFSDANGVRHAFIMQ